MKYLLIIVFTSICFTGFSQTLIKAIVKDNKTKEPLAYCNISVKGQPKGTITNTDGTFSISVDIEKDIFIISYLGYKQTQITAKSLISDNIILLEKEDFVLSEVTVVSDEEPLVDLIHSCSKTMAKNDTKTKSKVYYGLETEISNQPAEMLECYYNANLQGHRIIELLLKNGRIGLSVIGNRIFMNQETSNAIRRLNLFVANDYFPLVPMQCEKKEIRKNFKLFLRYEDSEVVNIAFSPRSNESSAFSGEVWIDKETNLLLKTILHIENANIHPFESVWEDTIDNVCMDIIMSYKILDNNSFPEYFVFNCSINYHSVSGAVGSINEIAEKTRIIKSNAVLYFYDYDNPFILPYFEYDDWLRDYTKLSMIPYNKRFWENNSAMLLTYKQKEKIGFFAESGYQMNFTEGNYGRDFLKGAFWGKDSIEYVHKWIGQYVFWSPENRIFIDKTMPNNKTATQDEMTYNPTDNLCRFKVQILLDVNKFGDSIFCNSYTVFDEEKSFYKLPVKDYTNPFTNIYFDLYEIERRKMQHQIDSLHLNLQQIDSLYYKTKEDIDLLAYEFQFEVDFGKKEKELKKWNQYVYENLGFDNIKLFEEYYAKRDAKNDSIIKAGGTPPLNKFE